MKNFKKVVFGLLAMLVMVTSVRAESLTMNKIDDYAKLSTCLTNSTADPVVCSVIDDIPLSGGITVSGNNVTLNLGNHKLDAQGNNIVVSANKSLTINGGEIDLGSAQFTVNDGSSLVVNGTKITTSGSQVFNVTGHTALTGAREDSDSTILTVNGTITNNGGKGVVTTSGNSVITVNGDWATTGATFDLAGTPALTIEDGKYTSTGSAVINATAGEVVVKNGTFTNKTSGVVLVAGGEVVIEKGTYSITNASTAQKVFEVTAGALTIEDATVSVNNGNAVSVSSTGALTIKDGSYTTETGYALALAGTGKIAIENGKFVSPVGTSTVACSATDVTVSGGEYTGSYYTVTVLNPYVVDDLEAVRIGDVTYIGKTYSLEISVEEENGEVITLHSPQELLGGHTYKFEDLKSFLEVKAADGYVVKYVLVVDGKETVVEGDSLTMPESDAKLVVSFVEPSEQQPAPETEGNNPTGDGEPAGDETEGKVPSTFDGIASIVTMAISSVSAAGYSIKKIIRK